MGRSLERMDGGEKRPKLTRFVYWIFVVQTGNERDQQPFRGCFFPPTSSEVVDIHPFEQTYPCSEKIVISYQGRKTKSFFGTSSRAEPESEFQKNSRFEPEDRILLFGAESKKECQKAPFLRSRIASKTVLFETPCRKIIRRAEKGGGRAKKLLFWPLTMD